MLVVVTTGGTVLTLLVKTVALMGPVVGCEVAVIASVVVKGSETVIHNHPLEIRFYAL